MIDLDRCGEGTTFTERSLLVLEKLDHLSEICTVSVGCICTRNYCTCCHVSTIYQRGSSFVVMILQLTRGVTRRGRVKSGEREDGESNLLDFRDHNLTLGANKYTCTLRAIRSAKQKQPRSLVRV